MRSAHRRSAVVVTLSFVAFGCGGGGGGGGLTDPTEAPVIETGSGVVGTKGGVVAVTSSSSAAFGTVLVIPAGALAKPVEIRISGAPSNVTLPTDPQAIVVRFEPAGLQFQAPVAVGLSYAHRGGGNPSSYRIVHYDPGTGTTTDLPTVSVDTGVKTLYGATNHFSYFALTGGAQFGTMTDARDKKQYRTVVIGTQTWMAQNLDFRGVSQYCADGKTTNCDTYGALYLWTSARSACPSGWRLATDPDWMTLERYLGVEEHFLEHPNAYRGITANAGGRIKDTSQLWSCTYWGCGENEGANNETGFSALPGGYRHRSGGTWEGGGEYAHFWTATQDPGTADEAWSRRLWYRDKGIHRGTGMPKDHALSVRCVKN